MRWVAAVLVVGLMVAPSSALAQQTVEYGWEDNPTEAILGSYYDIDATVVEAPDPVYEGTYSVKLVDQAASGTPQAYVAWVVNLQEGDEVYAEFYRYDVTPGAAPSCRIWGHYTSGPNIDDYAGSADGNYDYGDGLGWDAATNGWTFEASTDRTGLVIEARTYSEAGDTVWIDAMKIIAPDHATIYTPGNPPVPRPTAYGKLTTTMIATPVLVHGGGEYDPKLCTDAVQPFSYHITSLPGHGELDDDGTPITVVPHELGRLDSLTYTPDTGPDYSGVDTFDFYVEDADTNSLPVMQELGVQKGGVVISEVMHDPTSYDSNYEFIEIYNHSGALVDLTTLDVTPSWNSFNNPDALNNLDGEVIADGEVILLAIDNSVLYPDDQSYFRCEWGEVQADQWRSLPYDNIIEIPVARWEFLYAAPHATDCASSYGSRILLFSGEELLDAVDLGCVGGKECDYTSEDGGTTYAIDRNRLNTLYPADDLDAENNEDLRIWKCSRDITEGLNFDSVTRDKGSPGYVPDHNEITIAWYDPACEGACCLWDGGCEEDTEHFDCINMWEGTWRGDGTPCPAMPAFVDCLDISGPDVIVVGGCLTWDYDGDDDVDLHDFAAYQRQWCVPEPIGACCTWDTGWTCTEVLDEAECAGAFLGFGTDCDTPVCEDYVEAGYGWEDGGTDLGTNGTNVDTANVSTTVHSETYALEATEDPLDGTPAVYVAFIDGLTDGDVVHARFWAYDTTAGVSPSMRIWAHYSSGGDPNTYVASASGNYTYTAGTGWEEIGYSWTFDSDEGTRDALTIELRLYSPTGGTPPVDYYIDDISVIHPVGTTVTFPAP